MLRPHVIGCLLLLAALPIPRGWAGVECRVAFPIPGVKPKRMSGLQLELTGHWVESPGYRPLHVRVSSLRPNLADRRLTVTIVPSDWSPIRQGVSFDITLPEGAVTVTKEIPVPQVGIWNQVEVKTREDGRELDDLSGAVSVPRSVNTWNWTEAYPSMLFIDRDAPAPDRVNSIISSTSADGLQLLPDVSAIAALMPPFDEYAQGLGAGAGTVVPNRNIRRVRGDDQETLTAVQRLQTIALLPITELPSEWLSYTSVDLVFISLEDLQTMGETYSEKLVALRRYVDCGGNLIVTGVGQSFEGTAGIDEVLAGTLTGDKQESAEANSQAAVWRELDDSKYGPGLGEIATPSGSVQSYNRNRPVDDEELTEEDEDPYQRLSTTVPKSLFRWRPVGWGRVIALAPDELRDASTDQWGWVLNDIGHDRWRWYRRHGLARQRQNQGFWEFLIPGVGAAPVRAFLGLISAFVVLIGPVNFFLLKRTRRLYLLLVTVPLAAALVIAGLFGFALVKDGLGTRARLRSYSEFLPSGQAVTWSRQSYYAGLSPSSGLVYPVDAAVFPIDATPSHRVARRRLTQWSDAHQQLAAGFLSPRTTSQNLVIRCVTAEQPVSVRREGAGVPSVTNDGAVRIDHILVRDGSDAFWANDIDPGATVQTERLTAVDARDRYTKLLREHRPATPRGFTAPLNRNANRFYYNNFDGGFAAPSFQTNLMESCMGRPVVDDSPTKRLYYAISTTVPDIVPVGVESCQQEAGFHVVQGHW